jgi:ubiquinone/menaquinone biosynthesis C-methylase UbiE
MSCGQDAVMSERVEAAYDDWSTSYDRDPNRTRDLDAEVVRTVFAGRRFDVVVEAGCGTGKNTASYAAIAGAVHAFDSSAGMLAQAREKVDAAHVSFAPGDVTRRWPFADRIADLVAFDLVLEHVDDLRPAFAEAARVLRAGGELFVCEFHPFRQYAGKHANFRRGTVVVDVPFFVHHVSDFTGAAAAAGMRLVELREWWHAEDAGKPPRLLSLRFSRHPA